MSWSRNGIQFSKRFESPLYISIPLTFNIGNEPTLSNRPLSPSSKNIQLEIAQDKDSVTCVWDACLSLIGYFSSNPQIILKNKKKLNIIEIGAGCGALSISLFHILSSLSRYINSYTHLHN